MPTTDQAVTVKLELPGHVYETLSTWAASEIGCTAEDVLEALSEELSSNAQLRAFAAGLVTEWWPSLGMGRGTSARMKTKLLRIPRSCKSG
jgi:hypothetical protein